MSAQESIIEHTWLNEKDSTDKRSVHDVLIEQAGLTQHAKQRIDSPLGALLLFVHKMLSHIQRCTEAEAAFPAHRVLRKYF